MSSLPVSLSERWILTPLGLLKPCTSTWVKPVINISLKRVSKLPDVSFAFRHSSK